jgi:hypothetical protein
LGKFHLPRASPLGQQYTRLLECLAAGGNEEPRRRRRIEFRLGQRRLQTV